MLTERDIEIVRWLGRHRLATAELVMRRFGLGRSKAYERLSVLYAEGLVRQEAGIRSARVYLATRLGLRVAGLNQRAATVSAASFAHDIAVCTAAIALEHDATLTVVTEREMHRADEDDRHRYRVGYSERGLWPDLVTIEAATNRLTAIEVELTLKKADRIADKLLAYTGSQYDHVRYLCGNDAVAAAVRREGKDYGLLDRVLSIEPIAGAKVADPRAAIESQLRELRLALARERETAAEAQRRAEEAERQAAADRATGERIIDAIDVYLRASRAERSQTRERWAVALRRHGR